MLEWVTFVAAALAAVGTFVGPFVAYRSVTRTAGADRQQADVNRYIAFVLSPDAVTARLGVAQLQYLLEAGNLTDAQINAVSVAITTGLAKLEVQVTSDPDTVAAVRVGPVDEDLDASALDLGVDDGDLSVDEGST